MIDDFDLRRVTIELGALLHGSLNSHELRDPIEARRQSHQISMKELVQRVFPQGNDVFKARYDSLEDARAA
jgi:hypothetical protein